MILIAIFLASIAGLAVLGSLGALIIYGIISAVKKSGKQTEKKQE